MASGKEGKRKTSTPSLLRTSESPGHGSLKGRERERDTRIIASQASLPTPNPPLHIREAPCWVGPALTQKNKQTCSPLTSGLPNYSLRLCVSKCWERKDICISNFHHQMKVVFYARYFYPCIYLCVDLGRLSFKTDRSLPLKKLEIKLRKYMKSLQNISRRAGITYPSATRCQVYNRCLINICWLNEAQHTCTYCYVDYNVKNSEWWKEDEYLFCKLHKSLIWVSILKMLLKIDQLKDDYLHFKKEYS